MEQSERKFANDELAKAVAQAKTIGLKVWTWESDSKEIRQVFVDNGTTYGSISAFYSGLKYGTCHKPCAGEGTGYVINSDMASANREDIERTLQYAPDWAYGMAVRAGVKKETFEQHIKRCTLKYYEL